MFKELFSHPVQILFVGEKNLENESWLLSKKNQLQTVRKSRIKKTAAREREAAGPDWAVWATFE